MRNWRIVAVVAGLVALVGVLAGSGAASDPPGVVVMSGLDNPRGLAFGPEGGLYVAEAGRGGPGPPCADDPRPAPVCRCNRRGLTTLARSPGADRDRAAVVRAGRRRRRDRARTTSRCTGEAAPT